MFFKRFFIVLIGAILATTLVSATTIKETKIKETKVDTTRSSNKGGGTVTGEIQPPFTEPGVVYSNEGQWVGSDYLGKLSKNLRVFSEVYSTIPKDRLPTDKVLTNEIMEKLKTGGFSPSNQLGGNMLPFLHLLVLIQPIEDRGFTMSCQLRLFESVKLDRVILESNGDFQAITWEKEVLLITHTEDATTQLLKNVDDLVSQFVARYQAFETNTETSSK